MNTPETRELDAPKQKIDYMQHPEVARGMGTLHRALIDFTGVLPEMTLEEFTQEMRDAISFIKEKKMIEGLGSSEESLTDDPRAYNAFVEDLDVQEKDMEEIRRILGDVRVLGVNYFK